MSFDMGTGAIFDYGSGGYGESGMAGGDLAFSALQQGIGQSGYDASGRASMGNGYGFGGAGLSNIFGGSSSNGAGGFGLAMGGISDLFNIGVGLYSLIKGEENYKNQLAQAQINKGEYYAREDSAIQRRMNDLKAAGLSPTLAAGTGAASGMVVPVGGYTPSTPQIGFNNLTNIMGMLKVFQDISQSESQKRLNEMQMNKLASETSGVNIENLFKGQELSDYVRSGINPRHASGITKTVADIFKLLKMPDPVGDVKRKSKGIIEHMIENPIPENVYEKQFIDWAKSKGLEYFNKVKNKFK